MDYYEWLVETGETENEDSYVAWKKEEDAIYAA